MNSKTIAIGLVAILVISGVAGALVLSNGDSPAEDEKKGWYAWDPVVMQTKSANFSVTPLLVPAAVDMYETIYEKDLDLNKYTISDVPADFLSYDSLVVSETDDKVVVKSTIREKGNESGKVTMDVEMAKCPDNLITTSGYAACLYTLLEMKYGGEKATDMLWDYIYGLDKSSWTSASMEDLYGLPIPDDIVKVSTTYSLLKSMEEYTKYVEDCTKDGQTLLIMASGALGNDASELTPFFDMMAQADGRANAAFFFSNGISDVVAAFDVIGAIYNLQDEAARFIDDFRLNMYAINQASKEADKGYTVYLESNSGKAAGTGTITNDVFNMLCLTNINQKPQWELISDEVIVQKEPHVIMFYDNNTKSLDELMRVTSTEV